MNLRRHYPTSVVFAQLSRLKLEYQQHDVAFHVHIDGLKLECQRLGEWEPVLEPSVIRVSSLQGRIDVAVSGDEAMDGHLGDGDCNSLRINASVPLIRATTSLAMLVSSALDLGRRVSNQVDIQQSPTGGFNATYTEELTGIKQNTASQAETETTLSARL